jgi:Predicted dehydrogenases and related proteins
MNEFKWGIIGPGNIARDFTRDLQLVRTDQRVVAVLSHQAQSADQFAQEFNTPGSYTDIEDFLDHEGIQAIYIASPHPHHFEQTLACLEKKIPVLCEKPLTINAAQAEKLVETSRSRQCFLMEGMWIRFLPSIQLVLSLLAQGRIGKIISVKASMGYKAPQDPDSRYFNPALGGGSLLDLGIYPVFLATLLLGPPDTIKAIGTLSDDGIDEDCSMLFHYDSGQHAILESSLLAQSDLPAEIIGESGSIRILDPWFEKCTGVELNVDGNSKIVYPCQWEGHGLYFEAQEVLHCLSNGRIESEMMPHEFSLQLMRVMDQVRNQINVTYDLYE